MAVLPHVGAGHGSRRCLRDSRVRVTLQDYEQPQTGEATHDRGILQQYRGSVGR